MEKPDGLNGWILTGVSIVVGSVWSALMFIYKKLDAAREAEILETKQEKQLLAQHNKKLEEELEQVRVKCNTLDKENLELRLRLEFLEQQRSGQENQP